MLTWQSQRQLESPDRTDWPSELEESRQHYATVRIQELQRSAWVPFDFADLLKQFLYFGHCYDQGFRLRQLEK